MGKKRLSIPASSIKPFHKSISSKNISVLPCSKIVKTHSLKMKKPCTPKSSVQVSFPKGVLGMIQSPVMSSAGNIRVLLIDAATAAQIISGNRKRVGDIVVITPSNKVRPAHLPDLSDLALLPKPVKYFVRWVISTQGGKDGFGYQHVLPAAVKNIVDPSSEIPTEIESCVLSVGKHLMTIPSYRNDFKLFSVEYPDVVSKLIMHTSSKSSSKFDGREIEVEVEVVANENLSWWKGSFSKGLRYMIWNCRDMGRDSFLPMLRFATQMHMPHIIILTETRVSIHMARLIYACLNPYAVYGISTNDSEGGYAVLSFSRDMNMKLLSAFSNQYCWCFDLVQANNLNLGDVTS